MWKIIGYAALGWLACASPLLAQATDAGTPSEPTPQQLEELTATVQRIDEDLQATKASLEETQKAVAELQDALASGEPGAPAEADVASKEEVGEIGKIALTSAADQLQNQRSMATVVDLVSGGGELPKEETKDALAEMQSMADDFASLAKSDLVKELGHEEEVAAVSKRAKAVVQDAQTAQKAGKRVASAEVLNKMLGEMEEEISSIATDAQDTDVDEEGLEKQQEVLRTIADVTARAQEVNAKIAENS